jgi:two-component system, NarL family, invasion response regulator UvrY
MIRVFVAEDHAIVRDGLKRLLAEAGDLQLAGECSSGLEVLQRAGKEPWDVLLLDLSIDHIGGLEVLRRLREQAPRLRIVVLSMYPEEHYAVRVLKMGAMSYISKGRSPSELLAAIRTASQGKRYVTPEVADLLVSAGPAASDGPAHDRLSEREHQVFAAVIQGHPPGEIASHLGMAPSTVSTHLVHIRHKLGVRNNGEILQYAYRHGLAIGG